MMNNRDLFGERKILYSKDAQKEGFSFDLLPVEQQRLTKSLYWCRANLQQTFEARCVYRDIMYHDYVYQLPEVWRFEENGVYRGYILSCVKYYKYGHSYGLVKLLCDAATIQLIRFERKFADPVYKALRDGLSLRFTEPLDGRRCVGRMMVFVVKNEQQPGYDTYRSAVVCARLYTDEEEKTVSNMLDIMFEDVTDPSAFL